MAALRIEPSGEELSLEGRAEFLIGRRDETSGSLPDLDLSPHGAAEAGVSRRHARILLLGKGLNYLADLCSTNGTSVNGSELEPLRYARLRDGDRLELGKLALTFLERP